ncbi:MAG: hypothetical protein EA379_05075 [Phycisphaerales bacterium]|nr:MAG: hypothetical protein EA379_05075 [Phycisphaerales bacterium]
MNAFFSWLLDTGSLNWGDEGVAFGFERALAAWAWAGVVIAAAAFAYWSYRRLVGARAMRATLGATRALLILTIVVLIAGPRLVRYDETTERDWVLVLIDRSASMTIPDAPSGADDGRRITREQQLHNALTDALPMWRDLAEEKEIVWLNFDAGAYDADVRLDAEPGRDAFNLGAPDGRRTMIGAAIDQSLRRAAARPVSGVVVLSDGRSLDETPRAVMRRLQAERVPVHTVALGSDTPVADLAIRRAEGPGVAFVNDLAPVVVDIERLGGEPGARESATLRLLESATGRVLDERRVEIGDQTESVVLTHKPTDPGDTTWAVELIPDGPDLIEANNHAEFAIELIDRPMRVLYIDGYPRWEQRYLRNLLIRERSIVASTLMLAPDRRYLQEGDVEIDALPDSPEAWAEYDAILLGDVSPEVFTSTQLEHLREHIAIRGAGLIWIGGPGATPSRWWNAPLADLLPVNPVGGAGQSVTTPVVISPSALAQRLGVLQLSGDTDNPWPSDLADPDAGWSRLQWTQRFTPESLKPATEVLALAHPVRADDQRDAWPLLLSMRYGAGRVLYVATDEIWRWRYGRGELLPERFWLQMIRLLGRESLARSGRLATINVSPRRSVVEQPVRISVELLDQSLIDTGYASVSVRAQRAPRPGEDDAPPVAELTLRPHAATGADGLHRAFSITWLPPEPGEWSLRVAEPGLTALNLSAEASVALPDDELRNPETDHALLARLSSETGGRVFAPEQLDTLPEHLPNRQIRILTERSEPLWDTPLALLIVVLLLTLEWVGRKFIRLI